MAFKEILWEQYKQKSGVQYVLLKGNFIMSVSVPSFNTKKLCLAIIRNQIEFLGHIQAKVAFSQGNWRDLDSQTRF